MRRDRRPFQLRPFYVRTVRPHVWAIMLRTGPGEDDRMMATVGARGLGDGAARQRARETAAAMNAGLVSRDPLGGRIGAAADLGVGGPLAVPGRNPLRMPGPRPFTTAAEDRLAARRAIADAAAERRRADAAERYAAGQGERDRRERWERAVYGGRWAGD